MPLPDRISAMIVEFVENTDARPRIVWLVNQLGGIFPEQVEDLFISEARDNEGRQNLLSVWAFTRSFGIEFRNPLVEDNFDAIPLRRLFYIEFFKNGYDFNIPGQITATSRFSVAVNFGDVRGVFNALGNNCGQLARIVRERLLPPFLTHWSV